MCCSESVPLGNPVSRRSFTDSGTEPFLEGVICDDGCDPVMDVVGANVGTDDRNFFVRARRQGSGQGRTYSLTYRALDATGNVTHRTITVLVPHIVSFR